MKALVTTRFGSPAGMEIVERDIPEMHPGYALIRMHAATINPLSSYVRRGDFSAAPLPLVLSNDGAGTVVQGTRLAAGTRVAVYGGGDLGISKDGLQQQWVLVEEERLIVLPDSLTLEQGAALPINYVTAYQAITRVGRLMPGQTALVSGAAGALGHALVQTTSALGARVIAVASGAEKAAHLRQLGRASVIDLSAQDLPSTIMALTDGQGVDLAFDAVGGDLLGELLRSLKPRGAVVSIGFAGGVRASFDVVDLVVHEKRVLGYDAHLETDVDVQTAKAAVQRLAEAGHLCPVIDSVFQLEDFEAGYQRLASRKAIGAIVLRLQDA
ncbi:quinone oxidoreductase family protein [Paraburkholderia tropica]|nr:zinc-binding dehydrogenase [Paraburkholderia tropica]